MAVLVELPDAFREVDLIVVGGGTAGCVVASRLAEAYRSLSILVVEGGPDNYMLPQVIHPALYRANFGPDSLNNLVWPGAPEDQLGGRSIIQATGGVLGGGSSVNGAIYARGQSSDFDAWNTEGWSGKDVLPFLQKFEDYLGTKDKETHGFHGPVEISNGRYRGDRLADDFLSAMQQGGYDTVKDIQNLTAVNAASASLKYVSSGAGQRQDTGHTYIHPRLRDGRHPNLHVLVGMQVTRVLLDNSKRATGIEFRRNPRLNSTADSQLSIVRARKFVVLSAGTFGTPALLERSGIGSVEAITAAGVPVLHDLQGVGHGYQDHQTVQYTYNSKLPVEETWESIYNGVRNITDLVVTNDRILSWNGVDAAAKIRPSPSEVKALSPDSKQVWADNFEGNTTKPLVTMILINGILGSPAPFPPGKSYFTICSYNAYPESRGSVHITGPSINDPVEFRSGYLSDAAGFDLASHVWAYKKQRELVHKMRFFDSEIPSEHPSFSTTSTAVNDMKYTAEDDKAIEDMVRSRIGTTYHPLGTCKMAPEKEMGVVDKTLSVHGIKGLKIADLSIAPGNVAGNTMSTALMIGERAADIFVNELRLSSPCLRSP